MEGFAFQRLTESNIKAYNDSIDLLANKLESMKLERNLESISLLTLKERMSFIEESHKRLKAIFVLLDTIYENYTIDLEKYVDKLHYK